MCKKYILSQYSYLEKVTLFINDSVDDNMKEAFMEIMCNVGKDVSKIRPIEKKKKRLFFI